MKSEEELSQNPTEDRAALREELLRAEAKDRLQVFDALNREADGDEEEVPEMPQELRDQLVEQFGDRRPRQAAAASSSGAAAAAPGFFAKIVEFFQAKPLAAYGGLAAAACAVMFMMLQTGDGLNRTGGGKIDHVRGGGDGRPSATADVPVYLFPEAEAAEIVKLANDGREFVLCADLADFKNRFEGKWAVAVDLDRRVVMSFENGEASGEESIEGDGAAGVLLGVRAALDEMVK